MKPTRLWRALILWMALGGALLCIGSILLSGAQRINNRLYYSQTALKVPKSLFVWSSGFNLKGWYFSLHDSAFAGRQDLLFKTIEGWIKPKIWNLLLGCSSASDVQARGFLLSSSSGHELILGLKALFTELGVRRSAWEPYLCQSTRFVAKNGAIQFAQIVSDPIPIRQLSYKKSDTPELQIDATLRNGQPFGITLTYQPEDDRVIFTADFLRNSRLDGQIDSFLKPERAYLSGEIHVPVIRIPSVSLVNGGLALGGTFSFDADFTGDLTDISVHGVAARSMRLDGALDGRLGAIQSVNLAALVISDAAEIPALTQLKPLIEQKALPQIFYAPETPFELLRFLVRKQGRLFELSRLVIKHSDYLVAGSGSVDPETGMINAMGSLVLSDELTRSLIDNVPRLEILTSEGGRLTFPFTVEGTWQFPKIHADIKQITEIMISAYRSELVRRGNSRIETSQ